MSRDIRRRSRLSGLASSDLIQEAVRSISDLKAIPTGDQLDKTIIYVADTTAIYAYDDSYIGAYNNTSLLEPDSASITGQGVWRLITGLSSGLYADRWVDPQRATISEHIVVESDEEVRRGEILLTDDGTDAATLTVQANGDVYVTDVAQEYDWTSRCVVPADTAVSLLEGDSGIPVMTLTVESSSITTVTVNILSATQASPCRIITSTPHQLSNGQVISVDSGGDMTELTGNIYWVNVIDPTTIDLYTDESLTVPLDASGFTAYTSGGSLTGGGPSGGQIYNDGFIYIQSETEDERRALAQTSEVRAGIYYATLSNEHNLVHSNLTQPFTINGTLTVNGVFVIKDYTLI